MTSRTRFSTRLASKNNNVNTTLPPKKNSRKKISKENKNPNNNDFDAIILKRKSPELSNEIVKMKKIKETKDKEKDEESKYIKYISYYILLKKYNNQIFFIYLHFIFSIF